MKLNCALVNDLYVLYQEGELSLEVRDALEAHLKDCPDCCRIYKSGSGFTGLPETKELEPSKKMDEKIMLTLKIRKLKLAVFVILIIFTITTLQGYANTRSHLLADMSRLEQPLWHMHLDVDTVKGPHFVAWNMGTLLEQINDQNNVLHRNLNAYEKRILRENDKSLFLHLNLLNVLDMLHQRSMAETFTDRDELVLERISGYFYDAVALLTEERLTTNEYSAGGISLILHRVDILALAQIYEDINRLSLTYYQYNKLPEETTLLTDEELQETLTTLFPNACPFELRGREQAETWGKITFESKGSGSRHYGYLDPYTGDLISVRLHDKELEGPLLPVEEVEKNILEFLAAVHGTAYSHEIEYQGINHNFSSNVDIKLYSWRAHTYLNGYRLNNFIEISADARTGILDRYFTERGPVRKRSAGLGNYSLISAEDALNNLDLQEDAPKLSFRETIVARSALTGKLQPIHVYSAANQPDVFVNAVLGKVEYPLQY